MVARLYSEQQSRVLNWWHWDLRNTKPIDMMQSVIFARRLINQSLSARTITFEVISKKILVQRTSLLQNIRRNTFTLAAIDFNMRMSTSLDSFTAQLRVSISNSTVGSCYNKLARMISLIWNPLYPVKLPGSYKPSLSFRQNRWYIGQSSL